MSGILPILEDAAAMAATLAPLGPQAAIAGAVIATVADLAADLPKPDIVTTTATHAAHGRATGG